MTTPTKTYTDCWREAIDAHMARKSAAIEMGVSEGHLSQMLNGHEALKDEHKQKLPDYVRTDAIRRCGELEGMRLVHPNDVTRALRSGLDALGHAVTLLETLQTKSA